MTTAGYSAAPVAIIKDKIGSAVKTYFGATLGQETDIVNIVNALVYLESSYRSVAVGPRVSSLPGTTGYSYYSSSVIQKVLTSGSPTEKANVSQGLVGLGLCQVMGWNFVKGSSSSGKCEIEMRRPDLAATLCVAPGTDLFAHVLGDGNIDKAILAGLVILESKYKAVQLINRKYKFPSDRYNRLFDSRISAAVAGYLGLGAMDRNGTTPQMYSQSIVGGSVYQKANGTAPIFVNRSNQVSGSGPSTDGSNMSVIVPAGC